MEKFNRKIRSLGAQIRRFTLAAEDQADDIVQQLENFTPAQRREALDELEGFVQQHESMVNRAINTLDEAMADIEQELLDKEVSNFFFR